MTSVLSDSEPPRLLSSKKKPPEGGGFASNMSIESVLTKAPTFAAQLDQIKPLDERTSVA